MIGLPMGSDALRIRDGNPDPSVLSRLAATPAITLQCGLHGMSKAASGEDNHLKYPATFHCSDLMVLNKVSCTSGEELKEWNNWIERPL